MTLINHSILVIRRLSFNFAIPLIILLMLTLFSNFKGFNLYIFEIISIPLSCWWILWMWHELFHLKEINMIKSFSTNVGRKLLLEYIIILTLYSICVFLALISATDIDVAACVILHLIPKFIFLINLMILTMFLMQNLELSLIIVLAYVSASLFGILELLRIHNIFIPINENSFPFIIKTVSNSITLLAGIIIVYKAKYS